MNSVTQFYRTMAITIVAALSCLLSFQPSHAIEKGDMEIGIDVDFSYVMIHARSTYFGSSYDPPDLFSFTAPSRVRIGSFVSDNTLLEFIPALQMLASDGSQQTVISLGVGLGFHSFGSDGASGRFAQPILGLGSVISSGSDLALQVSAGFEVGSKRYSKRGLVSRFSGFVERGFGNDNFREYTTVGVRVGISFIRGSRPSDPDFR